MARSNSKKPPKPPVGPSCNCGQSPCARPDELDAATKRWQRALAKQRAANKRGGR